MSDVSQSVFDSFVQDLENEGASVEDAVLEALDTLKESNLCVNRLFIYKNQSEKTIKEEIEGRLQVLEDAAESRNSVVNASFCTQSIQSAVNDTTSTSFTGICKLLEARKIVTTIIKVITVHCSTNDETTKTMDIGEESDSDDDEDENRIHMIALFCNFLYLILDQGRFDDFNAFIALEETNIQDILNVYDQDSEDDRVANSMLNVFAVLIKNPSNKALFASNSLLKAVELTRKLHFNEEDILSLCNMLEKEYNV